MRHVCTGPPTFTAKAGLENMSISGDYRAHEWMWPSGFRNAFLGESYREFHQLALSQHLVWIKHLSHCPNA